MSRRLVCAISGHGYGHLTQCAALLNRLPDSIPNLHLHLISPLPTEVLAKQLHLPFTHTQAQQDVGLVQPDALQVDLQATAAALQRLHEQWPARLQAAQQQLQTLRADLLIADVPYLAIAAAAAIPIPSVAIASLSWDAVLAAYFQHHPAFPQWWQTMRAAYARTTLALLPTPAIQPHPFPNARTIDPLTVTGHRDPARLRHLLQIEPHDQRPLVLLSLGGIPAGHLPIHTLQGLHDCHWLIDAPLAHPPAHLHPLPPLRAHLPFSDLAASVDAVISKPGYNMAVAATLQQIPFLYIKRGTFPDEPFITAWAEAQGRAGELTPAQFQSGQWLEPLFALLQQPAKAIAASCGPQHAVQSILSLLP
jgi:hypothetical protein